NRSPIVHFAPEMSRDVANDFAKPAFRDIWQHLATPEPDLGSGTARCGGSSPSSCTARRRRACARGELRPSLRSSSSALGSSPAACRGATGECGALVPEAYFGFRLALRARLAAQVPAADDVATGERRGCSGWICVSRSAHVRRSVLDVADRLRELADQRGESGRIKL